MILPGTYQNGFAPRDGEPLFPELWRGCVGAWNPGLGPSGLTLRDWSPYKNHGTLTNMDAGTDWVASQGRYALDFDGVNDFVGISGVTYPATTSDPFSIVVWGTGRFHVSRWRRLVSDGWILVDPQTSGVGKILFGRVNSIGAGRYTIANSDHDITLPYCVVCTDDGSNTLAGQLQYFNGRLITSRTIVANQNSTPDAAAQMRLGATDGTPAYNASTKTDVMFYNRALSPNEIRLLASRRGIAYEMAPPGWTQSQIAAYRARYYSQLIGGGVI
jgi:hypothetical protein